MLAAHRDQENRVLAHQAGPAAKQQLQAKMQGGRYPMTPLKVPLNDENANRTIAGKNVLHTKNGAGKSNMVTPLGRSRLREGVPSSTDAELNVLGTEPRTGRAPLGNKTTNAKAKATQQGVKDMVREFEKTQHTVKPTTTKRVKQGQPQLESSKLEVHVDKNPLIVEEDDIEYAAPRPKDLPYESDVIPSGSITFEGMKKENMFKGYYQYYHNPVDENGVYLRDKEMQEQQRRAFKKGDEQILKDMEQFDWSIGDVPGSGEVLKKKQSTLAKSGGLVKKTSHIGPRPPSTLASRQAASALAMAPRASAPMQIRAAKPLAAPRARILPLPGRIPVARAPPTAASAADRATANAASRSTIGYSKGRTALSAIHSRNDSTKEQLPPAAPSPTPRTLIRSVSTASSGSDNTITPARFAQKQVAKTEEWKKLEFLSIFDVEEDEDDMLGGAAQMAEDDDDFQLTTTF